MSFDSLSRWWKLTVTPRLKPARLIFLGFFAIIMSGTSLLMLPIATKSGKSVGFVDALFTATSATCVTGLTTLNTSETWSGFGKGIIILLIQVGGLGIMTLASLVGLAVVKRISLKSRLATAAETKNLGLSNIKGLLRSIVTIVFIIEFSVSLLLFLRFWLGYGFDIPKAIWYGIFHGVSAFNNAGFSLFKDSLIEFNTDPLVVLPICLAVIMGGIGFPVIIQLRKYINSPRKWALNTRIVVAGTLAIIPFGAIAITTIEWTNTKTLANYEWYEKILLGFGQSIQTRTAGFDILNGADLRSSTWLVSDILMFIGAGPAGTAGGIKLTTFIVLFFIVFTEIQGGVAVNVFGKRIPRSVHRQAITIALLSMALIVSATVFLGVITKFNTEQLLYEVISAFGTVGLSTGITSELPILAKIIIILVMFIGRLGPATFATALALRERPVLYELPQERPIIG